MKWEEDSSVFNGHFEVDILIDKPPSTVWEQFLDMGSWVTSHGIEYVEGNRSTLGSITKVTWKVAEELGMPPAHHHYCKIIKLVPKRQYVLKTYAESGGSYGMQITAFDDTRFVEERGSTRVIFNFYAEIRSDLVAKDPDSMNFEGSKEGMLNNLRNLKRIVEGR